MKKIKNPEETKERAARTPVAPTSKHAKKKQIKSRHGQTPRDSYLLDERVRPTPDNHDSRIEHSTIMMTI